MLLKIIFASCFVMAGAAVDDEGELEGDSPLGLELKRDD